MFLSHRTGDHPERPERLTSIVEKLKRDGLWDQLRPITETVPPDTWIRMIHSEQYLERLNHACRDGQAYIDTPDSAICPDSYRVAHQATALALAACDIIMAGKAKNGFCALRPPGHHAEKDRSMGFCLLNNVAIAGRYLQRNHGLEKILILDWDAHHGNGTQHSFEADNTVFYASIHQHPDTLYPGTGRPEETGRDGGEGFTLNLTLAPGQGDQQCLKLFREDFLPKAQDFEPDFVLISAGFDGHRDDPLAQLNMTKTGYETMTNEIKNLAQNYSQGRVLSFLEGGYQLEALSDCVAGHLRVLMN